MTAFRATYSDLKVIKTRKCVQIIFEVPTEHFDAAYEVLGGLPNPAVERWFGIAAIRNPEATPGASVPAPAQAIQPRPERVKRDWRDLPASQQAAMRSQEPIFEAFLREVRSDDMNEAIDADECIKLICGVSSKSELNTNHKARVIWNQLDLQYQAWRARERVA